VPRRREGEPIRGITFILFALIASCGGPPAPPPKVFDVQIDARASSFSLAASMFFPREISVHAGDTVRFTAVDRGEIHTVTFGRLVDSALETFARLSPGAPRPTLASLGLPPVVIGDPPTALGRTATLPCFLEGGVVPGSDGCRPEEQRQTELSGTQGLFNSGYLAGGDVFALRLSPSIKPGVYGFMCLLHGPDMSGQITIEERDRPVPDPPSVAARGTEQLGVVVRRLQPLVDGAVRAPAATVVAGVPAPGIPHTQATVFRPAELTVRRGEPVSWNVAGVHTISFGAPQDAVGLVIRASDRSWALNARLLAPEPPATLGAGASGGPRVVDGGAWDGRGFRSSGFINADEAPRTYRLVFSQPGTYAYKCLLHTDMEGTITVVER
jgi:plastocyanin